MRSQTDSTTYALLGAHKLCFTQLLQASLSILLNRDLAAFKCSNFKEMVSLADWDGVMTDQVTKSERLIQTKTASWAQGTLHLVSTSLAGHYKLGLLSRQCALVLGMTCMCYHLESRLAYLKRCLGFGLDPTMTSTAAMPISFAFCLMVVSCSKA